MNELTTLNQLVSEIKFFEKQAMTNYWEIGKRLSQAKEQVAHGEWGKWIKDNLDYSQSMANKLMKIFNSYSNSDSITNLNYTKALALLALDEEEREEVIQDNDIETMTTKELEKVVKAKKQAETDLEKERLENVQLRKELIAKENQKPIIKEVVKEVIHPLYEKTKNDKELLELQLKEKENENQRLLKKIEYEKNNSDIKQIMLDQYQITQQSIDKLKREKNGFVEQLKAMEHLATLKKRLEKVFTTELLPVNYIMDIKLNHGSQEIMESLDESLKVVEKWCSDMRKHLPNTRIKGDYIDV